MQYTHLLQLVNTNYHFLTTMIYSPNQKAKGTRIIRRLTFKAFQEFHCVIISQHLCGNVRQNVSVISSYSVYSIYGREEWGQRITI